MPRTFKFRGTDYAFEDSITDEEVFTFFVKKDPSAAKGMDPLAVEQTVRIGMDRLQRGAAREESTLSKLTPDFIEDPARAVMGAGARLATGAAVGVNKGLDMLADAAVELGPDPADNTLPARVYRRIAEDMKASTEYELNKSRRMYEYSKEFAKPSAAGEFQQFSDIVNPRRALPAVAGGVATTVSLALTGGAAVPLIFGTEYLDMYDRLAQEAPEESELRRSLKAAGYAAGATALEYAGTVGQVGAGAGLKYLKDAKLIPSTKLLNRLTDGPKNALFTYLVGSKRTRAVLGIGGEVITENLQDELQRYTLNEKATWEDYATTTALTALSAGFVTGSFTHLNTQSQKARENFVATLPSAYVQEHRATLARWVFGQYADAELFEDLNKAGIDPISNPNFDLTGKTEETRSVEFKDLNPELAMEFSRVKNKPLYESFLRGDTSLAEFYQTVYKAGNTGNYDGLSKGETFALLEFFAKNNILQELQDVTLHHSKTLPQDRIRVLKNVGIEGLGIERVQDMLWGAAQNTTNPRTGRVYETVEEYVNSPEGLTLIESITETEAKRLMQEEANRKNQPGPKPDDMIKGMFEPGDYYRFKLTLGQADVTTAVHETTHLITHRIDPESELAKTLVAFARKRGSKVKSLTEFGEKEHEDVARLAEAYLLTEQAPENATSEEKSAAARMAGMFKAVYENNYKDFGGAPDKFFGRKPAHKSFFDYLFYGRGSLPVFKTPDLVNLDDELWNPSATFSDEDFSPDFIPLEGSQTATSQSMPMRPAAPSALLTGPTQRLGLPAPVGTQLESGETIPLEGPTIPSGPTIPLGGQVQGPEVEVGQGFMKRKVQITFPDGPHNELYYLREELEKIGDLEAAETGDEASFLRRQHTKYLNALAEELGLPKLERDDKASSKKRKEARNDFINTMLAVSDEYQRAVKEAATAGEKAPSLDDLYSKAEYFRGNQLYLTKAGKEGAGERFYQTGKRSEPDLSFAKVIDEKGRTRAVAKADPRLAGVLAGNLYKGEIGTVIAKELLQNANDSLMELPNPEKGKVRLNIDSNSRHITIKDNGLGMSPEVMHSALVDFGGSAKGKNAAGGFGLAKFALFVNSKRIKITSIAKVGGEYLQTTLSGSGKDWADETKGLASVTKKTASKSTGTTLELTLYGEDENGPQFSPYDIKRFLNTFLSHSKKPYNMHFTINGVQLAKEADSWGDPIVQADQKLPVPVRGPGYLADVFVSKEQGQTSSSATVTVLNNGIYQFEHNMWLDAPAKLPKKIVVDVKSNLSPEAEDYPFSASREELKDASSAPLNTYVENTLAIASRANEKQQYQEALSSGVAITGTRLKLIDVVRNKTPEQIRTLAAHPIYQDLGKACEQAFKILTARIAYLFEATAGEVGINVDNLNFTGFTVGATKEYLGVHINGEYLDSSTNKILVDPATSFIEVQRKTSRLSDTSILDIYSGNLVATLLHEITHNAAKGHGESYAGVLTRLIGATSENVNMATGIVREALRGHTNYELGDFFSTISANSTGENIFGKIASGQKLEEPLSRGNAGMATSGTEGGASYGKAGSIDTIGRLYQRGRRKYVNGSSINENLAKGLKYPASMKEGITAKKLSWDFGAAAQIASGILKDPKHLQRIVEDAREGKTLLPPEEIMALHEFYVLQLTRLEQMKAKGSAYATAQEKVFRERLEKVRSEYGSRLGAGLAALGHAEGMHIFEELAKLIETRTGRLQRQIYAQMSLTDFAMLEESVSKKTAVEFMEELAKHPKMSDFQKRVVAAVDLTNPEKARFQIADALLALKKNQFLHGAIQAYQYTNMLLKPGARGSDFGSNVGMRLLSLYGIKPGRVAADMLFTGLGLQPHRQEFFREIPLNPFRAFKGFGKGITVAKDIITGALPWQEAQFRDKWEVSLSQAAHAGELLWKHGGPLTKIAALPLMATPRIVVAIDAMERVVSEEVMGDMMATRFAIMKKNGTYDQEITRMATELADKQKVAPEDRDAFIAALKQNPSLLIQTVGQAFATANTFTQAPGKVTSAIMSMRDAADKGFRDTTGAPFSPVKSLAMPFVVTLANVMKTGVALTPAAAGIMTGNLGWSAYTVGAGILAPKMWGDKWKELIGKQIAAHAMLYFLNWALDNDWLVGAPKSAAERDAWERQKQGKEAYSFKVMFGEEPTYFRIPMPFAWALVPAIQALERLKAAEKFGVDSPEAKTAFAEARSATWQFLLNSSFTRTALRFIGNQGEFNTTRSVASFLPMSGMFRELNNTYKTLVEGKATQLNSREANPLNAAMQETYGEHFTKWFGQVIPGLEEDIPERITYFGQPYSRSEFLDQVSIPQQWLPRQDIEKAHAIEFEFERLEFYPGLPQKAFKLGNRDIELNDDQYRDYCLYYGQLVYQNASQLIDMPQYRKMPDETQSKVVKGFLERMRSAARAKVVQTHQLLLY